MLSYELGHECSLIIIFDESCQLPFDVIVIVQDRIVEVIVIFLPFGEDAAVLLEASDVGLSGACLDVGRQWLLSDVYDAGLYCLFNCCFIKFILLGNQKAVLARLEEDRVHVHRFFSSSCLESTFWINQTRAFVLQICNQYVSPFLSVTILQTYFFIGNPAFLDLR